MTLTFEIHQTEVQFYWSMQEQGQLHEAIEG